MPSPVEETEGSANAGSAPDRPARHPAAFLLRQFGEYGMGARSLPPRSPDGFRRTRSITQGAYAP
ncbi:hypothetical protein GCM10009546_72460 [Actinomadura livida]|uniref:Uncharacterized protein n=1 Tax=Actinomadura livida TaxID=79909 RepID=A0ABN1FXM9_9ACTN